MKDKACGADRYGRLTIYPSLNPPGGRGFCRKMFSKIMKIVQKTG
jgi:hypothetical protein